ncbi:MAG: HIT family protein [Tannerellaceae bacterium]|jgi:histidine triad (HIT) family protein|nr:HIT family protein [Tannerellaceae bacterium]
MASLFTQIIAGRIPCCKVAENEEFIAFLDIRPIAKGHTLVVPKQETDYLFDLDAPLLGRLMIFAQSVAKALRAAVPCKRIGMTVIGLEVPHAHIHLIPINRETDMHPGKEKHEAAPADLLRLAEKIKSHIAQ